MHFKKKKKIIVFWIRVGKLLPGIRVRFEGFCVGEDLERQRLLLAFAIVPIHSAVERRQSRRQNRMLLDDFFPR